MLLQYVETPVGGSADTCDCAAVVVKTSPGRGFVLCEPQIISSALLPINHCLLQHPEGCHRSSLAELGKSVFVCRCLSSYSLATARLHSQPLCSEPAVDDDSAAELLSLFGFAGLWPQAALLGVNEIDGFFNRMHRCWTLNHPVCKNASRKDWKNEKHTTRNCSKPQRCTFH